MHARAAQREQQWKERALAGEQIVKQLLVLLQWCVEQIEGLKRHLVWLKKQQFGCKSEATRASDGGGQPELAAGSEQTAEPAAKGTNAAPKRRREIGRAHV